MEDTVGPYDRDYLNGVLLGTVLLSLPLLSAGLAGLFFLAPLPLIYFPAAHGTGKGLRIVLHALLLSGGIAILTGTVPVLLLSASMLPAGCMLAWSLKRRESMFDALAKGSITLGLTWIALGLLLGLASQVNPYREVLGQVDQGLKVAYEETGKRADLRLDVQMEVQAALTRIRELTPKIFPGLLATMMLGTTWLNIMLAAWLLRRKGLGAWAVDEWRLPYPLVWVFIVAGSALFLPGPMHLIGLNLLIVTVTLYCMQGFEVFNHLCRRWTVPGPFRLLIVFFLVIQAYGFIILALLGLADVWVDFRKPKPTSDEDPGEWP